MKVILLAAGQGHRMRPLTLNTPKTLLKIGDYCLIEYLLFSLSTAGFKEIVINVAMHPQQFLKQLGNGEKYGVKIAYSFEPENAPLETGGGILQALPLLGHAPFAAISADLWTDYPWQKLPQQLNGLAHLVLVDNPPHHPAGDFVLQNNLVSAEGEPKLNFSGIGVYHPDLFKNSPSDRFPLAPLLIAAMQKNLVTGEYYCGQWQNIGMIAQLKQLQHKNIT